MKNLYKTYKWLYLIIELHTSLNDNFSLNVGFTVAEYHFAIGIDLLFISIVFGISKP